jgi:hypothetical protein
MGRNNNTTLTNPATRFFEWSAVDGTIRYFDKELGERGENVNVDLPFKFLVLERVAQVTGGVDRNGGYEGFWSNAVMNLKTQKLVVRSKQGIEVSGLYEDIKNHPGIRYMQGLYIAYYEGQQLQIGFLKIKGAALSSWIEFTKKHRNIFEGAFSVTGSTKQKKGSNTYLAPTFEFIPKVSDASEVVAKTLAAQVEEYMETYLAQGAISEVEREYTGVVSYDDHEPAMGPWNPTDDDAPEEVF